MENIEIFRINVLQCFSKKYFVNPKKSRTFATAFRKRMERSK